MALLPTLTLAPGLYTEATDRGALNRWKDGLNVRFFKGNPEKVGGCSKFVTALFTGVCRALIGWSTLSYSRFVALGTSKKLYLTDGASYFDVTPLRASGTLANNPLTTILGSATVTVAHTSHGNSVGDHAHLAGATAVGGLTLNGEWEVVGVPDANHYTFTALSNATSGATGGGAAVTYQYEIPVGLVDSIIGSGWGMGGWGASTWGTARSSTKLRLARVWSLDNWGEDLIASPMDAGMYTWVAGSGTGTRAVLITNAPAQNRKVLISEQLRIPISFGSHDGVKFDRMLVRWGDSEDYTDWTPTVVNLAGDKRLDRGDEIVTALKSRDEIAIFTDTTLYSMTLAGDDTVFSFGSKGAVQRLMGPNAAIDVDGTIYAMCLDKFITYDGQVKELQCDVHSSVFGNLNVTQAVKVYADWNPIKQEVIFHYVSAGATEVDMCVGISTADGSWWLGDSGVARTAWLSKHPFTDVANVPLATKATGYLLKQETGVDNDGAALPYFLESYDAEIAAQSGALSGDPRGQGELVYRMTRLIPDFIRLVGTHVATVKGRKWPNDQQKVKTGINFNARVRHIDAHLRARQIAVRLSSAQIGADISIGGWRVDATIRGER